MPNNNWTPFLKREFEEDYFRSLAAFVHEEYEHEKIYPKKEEVFNAFYLTDLLDIKVVILGQDPYHQPNQAHGLCFSVKPGVEPPPSLKNIYKEIHDDVGCKIPQSGYLMKWARQGVFLLNTVLTVRDSRPNSHAHHGWEEFTDHALLQIDALDQPVVYLLWGRAAREKAKILTNPAHLHLTAAHPSPLSAYNGFFGCRHFSKANDYLKGNGQTPVDWQI